MRYIESWLTGLGLQSIIPKLEAQGITTPKKLAALTLKDMYEVVGVEEAEDRKKLYFLIQRLQTILSNKAAAASKPTEEENGALVAPLQSGDALNQNSSRPGQSKARSPTASAVNPRLQRSLDTDSLASASTSEEDLRVLRRKRRASVEPLPPPPPPVQSSASAAPSAVSPPAAVAVQSSTTNNVKSVASVAVMPKTDSSSTRSAAPPSKPQPSSEPTIPARRESLITKTATTSLERYGGKSRMSSSGISSFASSVTSLQSSTALSVSSSLSLSVTSTEGLIRAQAPKIDEAPVPTHKIRSTSPITKAEQNYKTTPDQPVIIKRDSPVRPRPAPQTTSNSSSSSAAAAVKANIKAVSQVQEQIPQKARPVLKTSASPSRSPQDAAPKNKPSNTASSANSLNSIPPPPPPMSQHSIKGNDSSPPRGEATYDPVTALPQTEGIVVPDMAIRVVVRKRPLSNSETSRGDRDVMEIRQGGEVHVHEPKTRVDLTKVIETTSFIFDDSFDDFDSNETIYSRTVRPLVEFAFDGGKSSCFAYGQTGSGKTFSLMGSNPHDPAAVIVNAGLYVLAARDIFAMRQKPIYHIDKTGQLLSVIVSCFEIYGGKLFDLLNERNQVKCLEDAKGQVQVPGLTEHVVESVEDLLDLMSIAHEYRSVGSTGANAESSRSHLIMQLTLRAGQDRANTAAGRRAQNQSGKLAFIDLAGSERGADTTHNNKQTRMEGAEINTSLLALKEVIRSLERKHGHTPFRGSKLTQVLKDSFVGEKTRTCMIACVSPSHTNCEHSLNTLRYADRVKEHQASSGNEEEGNAPKPAGNASSSPVPMDAPTAPPQRPATSSGIPSSRENRRNSVGSDGPTANNNNSKAPTKPPSTASGSRYSSAGGMAPVSNMGHSPVRAGQVSVPRRPSTGSSAPTAGGVGVASGGRKVPLAAPLWGGVDKNSNSSPVVQHHPALANSPATQALVVAAEKGESLPLSSVAQPAAPTSKSGLHALALAGTKLLQGKLAAPQNAARKHSINLELNESDEEAPMAATAGGGVEDALGRMALSNNSSPALRGSAEAENIRKTLSLLSAHKRNIAETVEAMKEEMELVQGMESAEERDAEQYVDALESVLQIKAAAVQALRTEVDSFRKHRAAFQKQKEGR